MDTTFRRPIRLVDKGIFPLRWVEGYIGHNDIAKKCVFLVTTTAARHNNETRAKTGCKLDNCVDIALPLLPRRHRNHTH